ncbi:chromosome segregation protein SMC [Tessaracoccus antarcticus]|uniref:Chromosome partition protein Smc n=1 Tax=Tessaracoccus antarcticus TaxID=2479848 RepID=A0A3M0G485_9ACTN|nr:chromosome segregation protein SMC [Tessaracoccus antarcticus]RMB59801.1 chromosome segregation protein SMC [Tessaracoccus antarcticus]
MYLKQLTLRGFKSFASATTLTFEPGITCVVGPNGSGKSNVVDALSWVMGEQGAKSLRGGKMEDVIFAGTTKRAPLGRAEVELTIDNSDGALPIEYSEVTITRTMFRSGGSDYSINGTPARLLDVQELLSDSGIGREMHVIVGQGQLDAILQATPESRRGFIEEAAGVLKHRKRKEKALRKLEGTKANLERLSDLIGELSRQLKPLGRQAETARKAAVIQAELRDAKARLLAEDLGAARDALAADLADEAAVLAAKDRAERAVRAASQAEDAAEVDLRQAGAAFDAAQETWYALASLRERVSTTISISAERMRAGANQPQLEITGGRDPEHLEREAAGIRERETELGLNIDKAEATLRDATLRRNAAEQQHAAADAAHATALRAVADRREGLARLTGQVQALQSRLQASHEEVERLQRRRDEATQRAEEAATTFGGMESSLSGLGAHESDLDDAHEVATARVEHHQEELAQLRATEATLARDRAALEARIEALRLMTERKDASAGLVAAGGPGVRGRLIDALDVEPGWERAVSAALQAAAESVVVEGLENAVAAVAHMAEQDMGRASLAVTGASAGDRLDGSVLELVEHPLDLAGVLGVLLGRVVAVEDLDDAHRHVEEFPGTTAVTRGGDVVSAWLVEGGSAATPSLLELSAQLGEAESALVALGLEKDRTRFAVDRATGALAAAQRDAAEALALLHSSDAELAAAQDRLGQLRQTQATALREAERLAEAMTAAAQARVADEGKLAALQARLEAASTQEVAEPDPAERDDKAMEARRARQAEMEARLALRTLEEQAKALAGRAEGLIRAAQAERSSRAKARAKAEQLRREAEVATTVHEAAIRLAELVDGVRDLATRNRDAADTARREAEAATVRARHDSRAAAASLEELVRGAHRDEMTRIEHRMRIEQLEEKALSELGMEPDPLVAEYGPDQRVPVITRPDGSALGEDDEVPDPVPYDRAEQTTRLRRAERNLTVLGRVNPLALEEFDAMLARHGFLAEQLDDLKRTRADLLELIDEVDRRVKEVFEAAYRDVETTFVDVFSRLFPGGEGRLVLTDPGDWLTTGVDVEARPAGKQVKRLSLLSGGERSLVAVAFLVSLFIARPSPFYILDEVEAALDDANLGRLLTIYEELRANSQLLIITHQKRTMEIADSLYGVTMRGDGISTVVSQRLSSE